MSSSVDVTDSSTSVVGAEPRTWPAIDLRRHVPRIALDWDDDAPGRSWQQVDATMVFADISGFTALTEKLARRGRIGAEELIETLNRIFGGMLDRAGLRGGELLKFGGDALLFVFRGEGHAARACAAAVEMRTSLRESAKIPTSVGRLKLSMSVGVHSGPVDFFLVGSPTRELLILGSAATQTAEAEHAAVAGEILVTEATARLLPPSATVPHAGDDLHQLRWRTAPLPPDGHSAPPRVTQDRLRTLFPNALGAYLADRVPDPEHKVATIGFARFSGTDGLLTTAGHDAVAEALHATLTVFEQAMLAEGVTLLATDLDSDGGKLFMASGVPFSSEDDEGRMLRAMRHVLDVGTPLPVQIGVNRGHVFAAEVGTPSRSAYSAMGDTTNTAARIMSKAGPGVLFAHPSVLEQSRTLFATTAAGPFPMKGKAVPVLVYDVAEEVGTREAADRSTLPLVGRDPDLAQVRDALAEALSGQGGVITVAAGTGLGKSRLIREAIAGFDATIATVRGEPYGVASPYRMLRDPVRQAFRVERDEPSAMAAQLLATFREVMPEQLPLAPLLSDVVHVPIPPTRESAAIEPKFRPERIADLLVRALELTVPGPFILVVEEGHWADEASTTVLRRVMEAAQGKPWAVVVARRLEGGGLDPSWGTRVTLGPLDTATMREIVIDATEDAPLRDHEIDGIVSRAQGNPLFVTELVRLFREVGSFDAMPDSLQATLDAQVDSLDPHARRVLRYASVLGRSFRREVLEETLRGDDVGLDEATYSRLTAYLEPDGGPTRLRFRNSMIRDAAYEGLAYRLRTKLHAAAGRAVETLSTDLESDSDTLSLHFWRAGDAAKTWTYARIAGDRAARAFSNVDAAVQYERALDAARDLDVDTDQRLSVSVQLVGVRREAALYREALDAVTKALALVRGNRLREAEMLALRATINNDLERYPSVLRDVTRAFKLLDDDESVRARFIRTDLKALQVSVLQQRQRFRQLLPIAREVADEARAIGNYRTFEALLVAQDVALTMLGDTSSIGAATREALASARAHGRFSRASVAASNLGAIAFYYGDWDAALELYAEARDTAVSAGDVRGPALIDLSVGEILVYRGDLERAEATLTQAVRAFRAAGLVPYVAYGRLQLARLMLVQGDWTQAEAVAADAEATLSASSWGDPAFEATLVRAEALTTGGQPREALGLLAAAQESNRAETAALAPRVSIERVRAHLALGEAGTARDEAEAGLVLARQQGLPYEEAQLLRLLGHAAAALDDPELSQTSVLAAAAILRRLGVTPRD